MSYRDRVNNHYYDEDEWNWFTPTASPVVMDPNNNNNNTATSVPEDYERGSAGLGILYLALFAVAVNLVLFLPSYFVRRHNLRRQRRLRDELGPQDPPHTAAAKKRQARAAKKVARYQAIEEGLRSRTICAHDDLCAQACSLSHPPRLRKQTTETLTSSSEDEDDDVERGSSTAETSSSSSCTGDDDDETPLECSICFDILQVGDIASWSAEQSACAHVFHHCCIKEWLLKHEGCPYCRCTFLAIDLDPLLVDKNQKAPVATRCFYCVQDGIVALPTADDICLPAATATALAARAADVPAPDVLAGMRGTLTQSLTTMAEDSEEFSSEEMREEEDAVTSEEEAAVTTTVELAVAWGDDTAPTSPPAAAADDDVEAPSAPSRDEDREAVDDAVVTAPALP
jgi:hypothetical protein